MTSKEKINEILESMQNATDLDWNLMCRFKQDLEQLVTIARNNTEAEEIVKVIQDQSPKYTINNFIGYFWDIVEDKYWDQDMLTFKQIEEIFKIMVSNE